MNSLSQVLKIRIVLCYIREATLQLSWNSKINPWTPNLLFKQNAPYFWLNKGLRVYLDMYVPGFPAKKLRYRYFRAMCNFWKQCFAYRIILSCLIVHTFPNLYGQCFVGKIFKFNCCNDRYYIIGVAFDLKRYKIRCFVVKKKVLQPKRYFLGNPVHTNPNTPSNLYWAKIWFIDLSNKVRVHGLV